MRRLCLSGFRLVAPPFAVHDAQNQGERQQVATFIANNLPSNKECLLCQRRVKDSGGNTSNLTKHVTIQEATKT